MLRFSQKTDPGLVRPNNEDSYFAVAGEGAALFAVADGLGGMDRGEEASSRAVQELKEKFDFSLDPETALKQGIERANAAIFAANEKTTFDRWMATTLTASYFKDAGLTVGHVGDCRIYRLRGKEFLSLTVDHSTGRHTLTRALGISRRVLPDIYRWDVKAGDIYVQCSDGLYACVPEKEMRRIASGASPEAACQELIKLANAQGGPDNITVQIIHVNNLDFAD